MVTVNSIPVAWLRHLDTGLNSGFMIQTMWLCLQKIRQRANFDGLCRFILMFPYFPRNLFFFSWLMMVYHPLPHQPGMPGLDYFERSQFHHFEGIECSGLEVGGRWKDTIENLGSHWTITYHHGGYHVGFDLILLAKSHPFPWNDRNT